MDIPVQVAVKIYAGYPNEPQRVQTIPSPVAESIAADNQNGNERTTNNYSNRDSNNTNFSNNNDNNNNNNNNNNSGTDNHVSAVNVNVPSATGLVHAQINSDGDHHSYPVTYALPYGCSQENIYRQTMAGMIDVYLEGFDISVVTYGQHGCGKTYTLLGPGIDCIYGEAEQGIVQRAARDIFGRLSQQYHNRNFAIHFGWIEICGDEIHDILGGRNVQCNEICEIFQLLKMGQTNRNQEASHSLITLTLEQQWITADGLIQHRLSTASFVDLCGTERMDTIDSMEHPISVPKDHGLQMLERIVSVLGDTTSSAMHGANMNLVNLYGQSTLTKLLRDSFGGRAKTLLILCVSPLEEDIMETTSNLQFAYKVQLIHNTVLMNAYSDNNMPLANLFHASVAHSGHADVGATPDMCAMEPSMNAPDSFGFKFAAEQWLKLVSNAEGLFTKLLSTNNTLNEQDRERIEEWMFLKQECEECLSSAEFTSTQQRLLGPILEADEPDETTASEATSPAPRLHALTVNGNNDDADNKQNATTEDDSDYDDVNQQAEYLEEKVADCMNEFTIETHNLIQETFAYDIMKSLPTRTNDDAAVSKLSHAEAKSNDAGTSRFQQRRGSISTVAAQNATHTERRCSAIQAPAMVVHDEPGPTATGGLSLSSADIAHLERVANDSEQERLRSSTANSAYIDAEKFLDSSMEMHPLRLANANKSIELRSKIRNARIYLKDRLARIETQEMYIKTSRGLVSEIKRNIPQRNKANKHFSSQRAKYQKTLKANEAIYKGYALKSNKEGMERVKADIDKTKERLKKLEDTNLYTEKQKLRIAHIEEKVREAEEVLDRLHRSATDTQKQIAHFDAELKQALSKESKSDRCGSSTCLDTRITNLDYVLKDKTDKLQRNEDESDKQQSLRHEIENLRGVKNQLQEERRQKLHRHKFITNEGSREMLTVGVLIDVIDSVIEFKNEMLVGRYNNAGDDGVCVAAPGAVVNRTGRGSHTMGDQKLITQLNKLTIKEMRTLLYKYIQKIIDLRISTYQMETQVCAVSFHKKKHSFLHSY